MRYAGLVMLLLCIAVPSKARDINRQTYQIGERAAGMGGAFVSQVGDAASCYYNPAGLSGLYKQGISLSASMYQLLIEDYRDALDVTTGFGDRIHADMNSQTFGTFPSSVVYLLPLDSNESPESFHHVLAFSVLVPHYDKVTGKLDKPLGYYAFEMKGSLFNEDVTYWAGPSYAVSLSGKLRLGISLFALFHLSEARYNLAVKSWITDAVLGEMFLYAASSLERSGFGITMLAQIGAQYDFSENFSVGLTVRSPTFGTFYSNVSMLYLNSGYAEDPSGNPIVAEGIQSYVDRIETEDVAMNYRLPLKIAAGLSYRIPDLLSVALDVSFHIPQGPYNLFAGPGVYPTDAVGNPIIDNTRALIPDDERKNAFVINANLGVEFTILKDYFARVGVYTDFSSVDQDHYGRSADSRADSIYLPRLHRIGATLGFGMVGEWTTTGINLNYTYGFGDTYGFNDFFGAPYNKADVTAHTITLCLAGSAEL
jgi:hypothetical protein